MSDHFDGPAMLRDPAVDITDFYAFPSPERPGSLVLIMDVFPMATAQSRFSDVVTHRFRLRPLTRSGTGVTLGQSEYTIEISFDDAAEGKAQKAGLVSSDGRELRFVTGRSREQDGIRLFAGLASDRIFMDVEAAIRRDLSGKLSFDTAVNTLASRDVLAIAVEVPFAPIVQRFDGATLIAAISETIVKRRGNPIRLERQGRPEIKNVLLANSTRDQRAKDVELRDLYDREDAFALCPVYRPLYESRLDANLAFLDGLDGETTWALGPDGRHPLRDLLIDDFLILDLARPFAPGGFLEIERALSDRRPHTSAGGRGLDDDILDHLLAWTVSGARGEHFGYGDAPSKPACRTFPYVGEPTNRADLSLPALLRS